MELKLFPWDKGEKPYFVNEKGFEWYVDKDTQRWVNKETPSGYKLKNVFAFYIKKDDYINRVLINNNQEIIYENTNLEALCTYIDFLKFANETETPNAPIE